MASPSDIAETYANIISEAKGRLKIIEQTLAAPPTEMIGYVAISDLCALQFRKTFEAIALGCLVVHDYLPGTHRMKVDTYRADKLLKSLEKLHPDFYPTPCTATQNGDRLQIKNLKGDKWLTKESLKRLYFEFDHEMHVGTLTRRAKSATAINMKSYREILEGTWALIGTHWINLASGERVLCIAPRGDKTIHVQFLERM